MNPSPRQRKQSSPQVRLPSHSAWSLKPTPKHAKRLLSYNEIPSWYSDNLFIESGYRPVSNSTRACLSSLFSLHNESVNIYSHLIPATAFLAAELCLWKYLQTWYPDTPILDQLVFAFFLLTAATCLGMSATFHTMMNHSEDVCHAWLQLDFIGIVILTLGDFVSGINMIFYCESDLKFAYWAMISSLSLISLFVLLSPVFRGPRWRAIRVGTFVAAGMSGFAPLAHGFRLFGFERMMGQTGTPFYLVEGLLLLLGAAFYMTRIPESIWPGRFDIFGSSHQVFHFLVVCATILQLFGIFSAFDYNYHRTCVLSGISLH